MLSEYIWQIILAIVGSNVAILSFIQYLIERHDRNKVTPEKQALLALCSERLESLLNKWIHYDDKARTVTRWATIRNLYAAYKALKGNGDIEVLYNVAVELKPTNND